MTPRRLKYTILVSILFFLFSCGGEEAKDTSPPVKRPSVRTEAKTTDETQKEEKGEKEILEKVTRNPFMSYIVKKKAREVERVKGPLECCELSLFKLIAVLSGGTEPLALVQAPDDKRYIVRRGDIIGTKEGRIVKIGERSILVREVERDLDGNIIATNDVEIKLPEKEK